MEKPGLFGMNGFIALLLTCLPLVIQAQEPGTLILIDAENKQAFTIRLGDQLYTSSGQGHLVISHLKDSNYRLILSFPKTNSAELVFPVAVHQKDLGFQLKRADSLWVLYNWLIRETIRPIHEVDSNRILEQGVKREDGFSKLMAAVVNDSSVMYNTYQGTGFNHDSIGVSSQIPTTNTEPPITNRQPPTTNNQPPAANRQPPAQTARVEPPTANRQPPAANDQVTTTAVYPEPEKKANNDSLLALKKQQAHIKDSLLVARKAFLKDSLMSVQKRQVFLKDSLITARKAMKRDSLIAAKRAAAKVDSMLAAVKINHQQHSAGVQQSTGVIRQAAVHDTGSANNQRSLAASIKKLREVSLKISRKMVFLDIGKDGSTDTVTLFVYFEPLDSFAKTPAGGEPVAGEKEIVNGPAGVNRTVGKGKNDSMGLYRPARNKVSDTASAASLARIKKVSSKPEESSACSHVATEADAESLRDAILKANTEQDKIDAASAVFASKCFLVSQVRFLATLFVSDKGKYRLLDAAHFHVADSDHFPELVDMLTDKNFQRKFLLMAEKRS